MSSETVGPTPRPAPKDPPEGGPTPPSPSRPPGTTSSSGDELNRLLDESLSRPEPDPFLGGHAAKGPASSRPEPSRPPLPQPDLPASGDSFDAVSIVNAFNDPTPVQPISGRGPDSGGMPEGFLPPGIVFGDSPRPASSQSFPTLDLSVPPSDPDGASAGGGGDGDEEDDDRPRGMSWGTLLLFSYASAVTVGLVWVLASGRRLPDREAVAVDTAPTAAAPRDPGRRADRSRKLTPPPPIAPERLTALGRPVRMGTLEATPLEITTGPVELERTLGDFKHRDGGAGALWLRLRLKNVSTDTVFAPLDEAFLREHDGGAIDSLIETAGSGPIRMFPLAPASEWSIVGQEFPDVGPGESFDALVVSAPGAADRLARGAMTWRIRLRTGLERTDTMGVRFGKEDVRPGP